MAVRQADVVLVGGGVMSATLGMMLRQLDPSLNIVMVERLDHVAHESTDGWNNAGTGHAALCEPNYTPRDPATGEVDIKKAVDINKQSRKTARGSTSRCTDTLRKSKLAP